jgi:hypothetical protein
MYYICFEDCGLFLGVLHLDKFSTSRVATRPVDFGFPKIRKALLGNLGGLMDCKLKRLLDGDVHLVLPVLDRGGDP